MKEIERIIEGLSLVAVDLRRSANELDEAIRNIERIDKRSSKDDIYDRILRECESRKQKKKVHGLNDLDKRERKLWKQIEKKVRMGTD